VRAHIYLCILGYFLRQLLKMERVGMEMSVREALRRVRSVTIASGDVVLGSMGIHPGD
jgi:hypothetical protein